MTMVNFLCPHCKTQGAAAVSDAQSVHQRQCSSCGKTFFQSPMKVLKSRSSQDKRGLSRQIDLRVELPSGEQTVVNFTSPFTHEPYIDKGDWVSIVYYPTATGVRGIIAGYINHTTSKFELIAADPNAEKPKPPGCLSGCTPMALYAWGGVCLLFFLVSVQSSPSAGLLFGVLGGYLIHRGRKLARGASPSKGQDQAAAEKPGTTPAPADNALPGPALEQLARLEALHRDGILSDEEFESKKSMLQG